MAIHVRLFVCRVCSFVGFVVKEIVEVLTAKYLFCVSQKLIRRTLQAFPGAKYFANRPILLPLSSLEISVAGFVLNLEAGDGNLAFPEARRCVMFEVSL